MHRVTPSLPKERRPHLHRETCEFPCPEDLQWQVQYCHRVPAVDTLQKDVLQLHMEVRSRGLLEVTSTIA